VTVNADSLPRVSWRDSNRNIANRLRFVLCFIYFIHINYYFTVVFTKFRRSHALDYLAHVSTLRRFESISNVSLDV
jgi:hypothetical protein